MPSLIPPIAPHPGHGPLRGPGGFLDLFPAADGRQYIVSGMEKGPGQLEITKAFRALRGKGWPSRPWIHRCRQWVEAASAMASAGRALGAAGQLTQAWRTAIEPGSIHSSSVLKALAFLLEAVHSC